MEHFVVINKVWFTVLTLWVNVSVFSLRLFLISYIILKIYFPYYTVQ